MKPKYWNLPKEIRTILKISDGWLVGSSAKVLIEDPKDKEDIPRDYDIIVTDYNKYQDVILHLEKNEHEINSCGGLKFKVVGRKVDIWPDNLENFIKKSTRLTYCYHFNTQTIMEKMKND